MENVWTTITDITGTSSSSSSKPDEAQQPLPTNSFTSGEIIFVTILVSIIAIAVGLAIQSILQRRRESRREKEMASQQMAVTTVEMGADEDYTDAPIQMGPSRRISMDSTSSGRSGPVYTKRESGGGYGYSRKDSSTSLASRVSADYKFAAIDHMNEIAQRGRHDG
jgi:hypothetical protein